MSLEQDVALRPEDFETATRNISNSEVTTYLACKRMYDFNFIDNIVPNETSVPLDRGSIGHNAFERYIIARLNGGSHEKSLTAGRQAFIEAIKENGSRIDTYMEIQQIWDRYMEHHKGWPEWELLGTEDRLDLELTPELKIAIRYDLKVREIHSGRILVGDWKFTFDFWKAHHHDLNPQMPKYISVLRLNGYKCDGGFVEEVRTRKITDRAKLADHRNLWKRSWYYPSFKKSKAMMGQHIAASLEIEKHRQFSAEDRRAYISIPVLNKFGPCNYCAYTDLCNSMNEGVTDLDVAIRTNYRTNTYGYNEGQSIPGQAEPTLEELL